MKTAWFIYGLTVFRTASRFSHMDSLTQQQSVLLLAFVFVVLLILGRFSAALRER